MEIKERILERGWKGRRKALYISTSYIYRERERTCESACGGKYEK